MNKPKLTISILISRNYDGVKKCLESIQPIMSQISSELILTDTGCGNKVRGLIEEYTDHIIDFEWIKDFSAARNAGLKEAKGEWFLYIDDDEWFDDVEELVDFFNSKECDKYNVAAYIQRNYYDMNGENYADHNVDRILRITPDLHFEHRVHEAYTGIDIGKKKRLSTFVHHYGYVYKNDEEKLAKSNRNRELLELECREHPKDMRMRYQLVMDCCSAGQYNEAIEAAFLGIKIKSDSQYWDALHTMVLYCYQSLKEWDNVIKYGEEFLHHRLFPFDEFGVRQYLICAYWNKEQFHKVCDMSKIVVDTYKDYKKNPLKYDQNQLMRDEFWQDEYIDKMILFILGSALATSNKEIISLLRNYSIREDIDRLVTNDTCKIWLMQMVFGTCKNKSQIEMFEELSFNRGIWDVGIDRFIQHVDMIFAYIALDRFVLWEEWILSHLKKGSDKEMYFVSKCFDYKLRSVKYQVKEMDESEQLEYVLGAMTSYAEAKMYYCELKYKDDLETMTMDDLLDDEKLAWELNKLVDQVDEGNVSEAVSTVRRIASLSPEWSDAIQYLPTYIELVLR